MLLRVGFELTEVECDREGFHKFQNRLEATGRNKIISHRGAGVYQSSICFSCL
jgi:hypothetical protein